MKILLKLNVMFKQHYLKFPKLFIQFDGKSRSEQAVTRGRGTDADELLAVKKNARKRIAVV